MRVEPDTGTHVHPVAEIVRLHQLDFAGDRVLDCPPYSVVPSRQVARVELVGCPQVLKVVIGHQPGVLMSFEECASGDLFAFAARKRLRPDILIFTAVVHLLPERLVRRRKEVSNKAVDGYLLMTVWLDEDLVALTPVHAYHLHRFDVLPSAQVHVAAS